MSAILRLSDGITTINLMSNFPDGFYLREYAPILSGKKGGGIYQDSPLADNRRLTYSRRETVMQPIVLDVKAASDNNMANILRELDELMLKAEDYWKSDWQNDPVWLEAKTTNETNTRYALVYSYRIEDYPAPYQQPFQQPDCGPVATEMTLFLEIGQWLDVAPNVTGGVGANIVGANYYPTTNVLRIGAVQVAGAMQIPNHANWQGLPNGATGFTVELWLRYLSTSANSLNNVELRRTLFAGGGNPRWAFVIHRTTNSNQVIVNDAGTTTSSNDYGASNIAATGLFDTNWHHVAFTYNKNGAGPLNTRPRMWVDGSEVTGASGTGGTTTGYTTEVSAGAFFSVYDRGPFVAMGWMRVSNTQRYFSTFVPPPLCIPPLIDANTVIQYNLGEGTGTVLDNAQGTAGLDATLTASVTEWDVEDDCMFTGVEPTTEEVFVANKFLTGTKITNLHIGTADSNRIGGSWPNTISHTASATYFGTVNPSPFNNVVLNIVAGVTTSAPITWQYWNGATWTTLTIGNFLDTRTTFNEAGTVILSWKPPTNWAVWVGSGVIPAGWYIRAIMNSASIQHAGPDDPYTVTWPFVQIEGDQVPGDIPALARMLLRPVSSDGSGTPSGAADKIIWGSRSLNRGSAFRNFINFSDRGNVSGMFVDAGAGAFVDDNVAPTGRVIQYTATTSLVSAGAIYVNGAISRHYSGRFRVFLRFSCEDLTSTSLTWIFRVQYGPGGSFFDSRPVVVNSATAQSSTVLDNAYLIEMSPIHIRGDLLVGTTSTVGELIFYPIVQTNTGTATIRMHDLVLMPVDEFSGEVERSPTSTNQAHALQYVEVDGTEQKLYNRAVKRATFDDRIVEMWLSRGVLPPSLQANEVQRVFFLERSNASATQVDRSVGWGTLGVRMSRVSRYLGFRGNQ